MPAPLLAQVAEVTSRPAPALSDAWVEHLRARFGDALSAVLLYGSCLHSGDVTDGIVDLYAVVRDYRQAYPGRALGVFNAALPPNVFYAEVQAGGTTLRAKIAVLSQADLADGASRWFHSYVWARFAQPSRILHARDEGVRLQVNQALAQAVLRFHREAVPALVAPGVASAEGTTVAVEGIWARGLELTYASELRPEGAERVRYHIQRTLADYGLFTAAAAPALADVLRREPDGRYRILAGTAAHRRTMRRWRVRRWQGKLLSLLRLGKSVFTFSGSADYAAWKLQRHTGIALEVTPFMRRHPLLVAPWMLLRLLRRGMLR